MFSMYKKVICLVSFVLVLGLAGDVQAEDVWWTNADPANSLWSTEGNWDLNRLPTSDDKARIDTLPGPTIANEGAVAREVEVAHGDTIGALTVDGGILTVGSSIFMGTDAAAGGTINMKSGTITVKDNLVVGREGSGTLNMTGGAITCGGSLELAYHGSGTVNMTGGTITTGHLFMIAKNATAIGHVNLRGGIIDTRNFQMRENVGSVGTMDVRAGTLIINDDRVSLVQGYIDNDWITAYDGDGTFQLDYDVRNPAKTTLSATHFLNPIPFDGGLVSPGEVELSWTLPDPCVPGQPVPVDVYFTDDLQALQTFTNPAAMQVVSKQNVTSVVLQTQPKTRYYWAVDTYIGDPNDPIFGPIFSFLADNVPPKVDAGADVVTWLVDGVMTKNLDATVTYDGAYTAQWTMVSEPNDPNSPDAVITDTSAEDTSITLSALGEYVLQLEAFDGEYTGSDTVTINVYNDSCEAAQSLPDYVPLVGDLNGDCRVDIDDLLLLLENWLKDISLTEE